MEISNNAALLIGNGINLYSGSYSWKKLLKSIAANQNEKDFLDIQNLDISYPEFFDLLCFNLGEKENRYKNLKPKIIKQVKEWKQQEQHKNLFDFAKINQIPILTTNYDTNLLSDEFVKQIKKLHKKSSRKNFCPLRFDKNHFTDIYPWTSYYSDHVISSVQNDFALWHIHGFLYYKRSLVIGAGDYAAVIRRLEKFLYGKNGLFENNQTWLGKNSWLDIFFHKELYIIGLALEAQEISLRWLFMEREKYFRKFPEKRKKTIYVQVTENGTKKISETKKFFLESLGIIIRELKTYDDIYSSWSIKN